MNTNKSFALKVLGMALLLSGSQTFLACGGVEPEPNVSEVADVPEATEGDADADRVAMSCGGNGQPACSTIVNSNPSAAGMDDYCYSGNEYSGGYCRACGYQSAPGGSCSYVVNSNPSAAGMDDYCNSGTEYSGGSCYNCGYQGASGGSCSYVVNSNPSAAGMDDYCNSGTEYSGGSCYNCGYPNASGGSCSYSVCAVAGMEAYCQCQYTYSGGSCY